MKYKLKINGYLLLVLCFFIFAAGCEKLLNPESEADIEREIFDLVNQHRISMGLNAFEWNETIAQQCRNHSNNMKSGSIPIGHDGFEQRFANIRDVVSVTSIAENVAFFNTGLYGSSSPASLIFNGWVDSAEHRVNIDGDFNLTGVGVAKDGSEYYCTQIYVKTN